MINRFLVILVFLTSFFNAFSQDSTTTDKARNTVYAELLGKGFYYSFNFERELFNISDNMSFNASLGFGLFDGANTVAFDPTRGSELNTKEDPALTKEEQKELLAERSSRKRYPGVDRFVPFEVNVKYSFKPNHHAVFGYGTTYWSYEVNEIIIDNSNITQQPVPVTYKKMKEWFAHLSFDYKFQKPEGGFFFKAGYTPLFFAKMNYSAFTKKSNYQASFNLGAGWTF